MRRQTYLLVSFAILSTPIALAAQASPLPAPNPIELAAPQFIALSVRDLASSVRWYGELFGLSELFDAASPDSSTLVKLMGSRSLRVEFVQHRSARSLEQIAGKPTSPDQVYGFAKVGFFVRDLDATIAILRAHGASIEGTWLQRPAAVAANDPVWTRNILVRDNSGNYVQFFESH